ncbi:MAG: hypothetical protein WKF75_09395, partial [Singulisphaera sp.]
MSPRTSRTTSSRWPRSSGPVRGLGHVRPGRRQGFLRLRRQEGRAGGRRGLRPASSGLIDPVLYGYDPSGKRIQNGDDGGRNIGQLRFDEHARPAWDFNPPADGEYTVQVRDLYFQQRGEPRFTYRLSVRRPRPDFRLMAVATSETLPDATVVRQGGNTWLDVLAFRADGFSDPIRVEAADLPPGISCEPVVIGPGKTSVPLVFHAAKDAPIGHAAIRVVGKATIGGADVVREARAGGIVWATVNTPAISRLADTIVLSVR